MGFWVCERARGVFLGVLGLGVCPALFLGVWRNLHGWRG